MKRLILLMMLVVMVSCVSSIDIPAASCSQTDVQNAINSANDNDTVLVPTGSCTWSSDITLPNSKGVSVIGAGDVDCVTGTCIGGNGFTISSGAGYKYRISGFRFTGSHLVDITGDSRPSNGGGWRVDHNSFVGSGAIYRVSGRTYGVFDNNYFYAAQSGGISNNVWDEGDGTAGWYSWQRGAELGSQDAVYVENNTLEMGCQNWPPQSGFTDGRNGGRQVWRFNTIQNGLWGTHGAELGGGSRGTVQFELYENDWSYTTQCEGGLYNRMSDQHRSGTGVIFNNDFEYDASSSSTGVIRLVDNGRGWGACSTTPISICSDPGPIDVCSSDPECSQTCSWIGHGDVGSYDYPCRDQIGVGGDRADGVQIKMPWYVWGNLECFNSPCSPNIQSDAGTAETMIAENRDFYNEDDSFDGTSGMGIGTLANRPSTCTAGVGYWATDQGSWNMLGNDGVLYKCNDTDTWIQYYEPLEYPHPLTQTSSTELLCGTDGVDNSCTPAILQDIIDNQASDNDTIRIANGTHDWTTFVTIDKAISITGGGVCNDCGDVRVPSGTWGVTLSRDGKLFHIEDTTDAGFTGRITGIKMSGDTGSYFYENRCLSTTGGAFITYHYATGVRWRIDNNYFELTDGGKAMFVCADGGYDASCSNARANGNGYILVDNNYFDGQTLSDSQSVIAVQRSADWLGLNCWGTFTSTIAGKDPIAYGDENYVFVEDNTFDGEPRLPATNHYQAVDCRRGGRLVFRHNYVHDYWLGIHGNDGDPFIGCQGFEVYENTFVSTGSPGILNAMTMRSGSGVVFNNTFSGTMQECIRMWERRLSNPGGDWDICDGNSYADGNWNSRNNVDCTSLYQPYGCCTGAGTGTCGDAGYPDGYPCINQIGFGSSLGSHPDFQPHEPMPVRIYNNVEGCGEIIDNNSPNYFAENRDYFYCTDTSCGWVSPFLATYTPYTYPHPLRTGGAPQPCTQHSADINPYDCSIDRNELDTYISSWKSDPSISLVDVIDAIGKWKAGGYS